MACRGVAAGVLLSFLLCQDAAVQSCMHSISSNANCFPGKLDGARVHNVAVYLYGDYHLVALPADQTICLNETWTNSQIHHLTNHF